MSEGYPEARLSSLDTLWFQVAGTLCNLECTHCFISCSPSNHSHEMMSLASVRRTLDEAVPLGVKEIYLTGGEPFLNREILEIIEAALALAPVTVLTNGLLLKPSVAERLAQLLRASEYSLDIRLSIDGYTAEDNDPIRGAGTFPRILEGIGNLVAVGINPVITVTEACEAAATAEGRTRFLAFLREIGLDRPRLKVMPLLRIGAETRRLRAYQSWETLRGQAISEEEAEALQCTSSRLVSSKGVYVCPILLDDGARLGATLAESFRPFELKGAACFTCWERGFTCRT